MKTFGDWLQGGASAPLFPHGDLEEGWPGLDESAVSLADRAGPG